MSDVVQRVLQMKLDDNDLQRNAKSAIKTLQALDEALAFKGSSSGVKELQDSVNGLNFSDLASNVETIAKRVSTLGVVGATVISKLTESAMKLGKTLTDYVSKPFTAFFEQANTGGKKRATNIDQAKFKLEGLGIAWDSISKDINYGVDQTAYGLDVAASAASQLAASNVEFGDSFGTTGNSPMAKALRGISGVAAMTSSSFEEISDIFTDAAGMGRVTNDTLGRIAQRGLNATATLAKAMHVTEAEVKDMASKGKISFNEFAQAMDDAYGKHAAEANKTFEGSYSNMMSAISRIGQKFWQSIRENGTDVFNAIRPIINTINEKLDKGQIYEKFSKLLKTGAQLITTVAGKIDLSFLDKIIEKVGLAFDFVQGIVEQVSAWVGSVLGVGTTVSEVVDTVAHTEEHILEMANRVIRGDFGNGEDRIKALGALGESYELIQNKVNELLGCSFRYDVEMDNLVNSTNKVTDANKEAAGSASYFGKAQDELRNAYKDLMDKSVGTFLSNLKKETTLDKLSKIVSGVAAGFEVLGRTTAAVVKGVTPAIIELGQMIGGVFLNIGSSIGSAITKFRNWMNESGAYAKIQATTEKVTMGFVNALKGAGKVGKNTFGFLGNVGGKIASVFLQIKDNAVAFVSAFKETEAFKRFSDAFEQIKKTILNVKDAALGKLSDALQKFMGTTVTLPKFDMASFAANVSDKIVWLLDKIESVKTSILGFFKGGEVDEGEGTKGSLFSAIIDFFNNFTIKNAVDWFTDKFDKLKEAVKSFFSIFTGSVASAATEGIENVNNSIFGIGELYESIKGKIDSFFASDPTGIKAKFKSFIEFLSTCKGNISEIIGKIADFLSPLKAYLPTIFEEFYDLLNDIAVKFLAFESIKGAAGIFEGLWGIGKFLKNAGKLPKTVDTILKSFTDIGNNIKGIIDNIASIPQSVSTLITTAGNGIKDVMTSFSEIEKSYAKVNKAEARLRNAKALLVIAAAIGIIALAMYGLAQLDQDQLIRAGIAVGAIAGVLAILAVIVGKFLNNGQGSTAGSTAVDKMASVLKSYKKVVNDFLKGIGKAALITSIGIAVALLGGVVVKIGSIPWQQGLRGVAFVGLLIGELVGALVLLDKFAQYRPSLSVGVLMILITIAVKMLAPLVSDLKDVNWGEGIRSVVFIGILLAELIAATAVLTYVPSGGGTVGKIAVLISIVLSIKTLANTVEDIGSLDNNQLTKGVVGIGIITLALLALIKFSSSLKKSNAFGTSGASTTAILAIAVAVKAVASTVVTLGKISSSRLRKGEEAMAIITAIISAMMLASQKAQGDWKGILGIAAVVLVVTESLKSLSKVDEEALKKAERALGIVMGIITAFMAVSKKALALGNWQNSLTIFVGIGLILAEIVGIFYIMKDMDEASLEKVTNNIGKMLLALSALMLGLSQLPQNTGFKSSQLQNLSAMLTAAEWLVFITAIEAIAGWIQEKFPELQYFIDKGSDLLVSIAAGLGKVIGAILEEGILKPLANVFSGSDLGETVISLVKEFIDMANTVGDLDESKKASLDAALDIVKSFGDATLKVAIGNAISNILGDEGLGQLPGHIEAIGQAISDYVTNISNVDKSALTLHKNAMTIVDDIANAAPNTGGLWQMIVGQSNLTSFAGNIRMMGSALSGYVSFMKDITESDIDVGLKVIPLAQALSDVTPREGGLLQLVLGKKDFTGFSTGLKLFGEGVAAYATATKDVPSGENINTDYGAAIAKLFNGVVPSQGSIADLLINGTQDFANWGTGFKNFGEGVGAYAESVKTVSLSTVTKAQAVKSITNMFNELVPSQGGLVDMLINGTQDFTDFGTGFKNFGEGVGSYATAIQSLSPADVVKAQAVKSIIAAYSDYTPKTGGLAGIFMGNADYAGFNEGLKGFADAVAYYADVTKDITSDNNTDAIVGIFDEYSKMVPSSNGLINIFKGSKDYSGFNTGLIGFTDAVKYYIEQTSGITFNAENSSVVGIFDAYSKMVPKKGSLTSIFLGNKDYEGFNKGIKDFGEAMASYSISAMFINSNAVKKSEDAADIVIAFAKEMPNTGGLLGMIIGNNDADDFGAKILKFGQDMAAYSEEADKIKTAAISLTEGPIGTVISLANAIPNTGGLFGMIVGNNDADIFSAKIVKFGQDMVTYSEEAKKIDNAAILASAGPIALLEELAKSVPAEGGLLQAIIGETDISSFGSKIVSFGNDMVTYSDTVKSIDFGKAIEVTGGIVQFLDNINAITTSVLADNLYTDIAFSRLNGYIVGLFSTITASIEEGESKDSVENIGKAIAEHVIAGFKEAFTSKTDSATNVIADYMVESLSSAKTTLNVRNTGGTLMEKFHNKAVEVLTRKAEAEDGLYIKVEQTFTTAVKKAISTIRSYDSAFEAAGNYLIGCFNSGITSQKDRVEAKVLNLMNSILVTVSGKSSGFYDAGSNAANNFSFAIAQRSYAAYNAAAAVATYASNGIASQNGAAYNHGYNFVIGFTNAIYNLQNAAYNAAAWIANCAGLGLSRTLQMRSPSRVTYGYGEYFTEGFANGILSKIPTVDDSVTSACEAALDTLDRSLYYLTEQVEDSFRPTITPVLDLNGIEQSRKDFGNLLNSFGSVSVGSNGVAIGKTSFDMFGHIDSSQLVGMNGAVSRLDGTVGYLNSAVNTLSDRMTATNNAMNDIDMKLDTYFPQFAASKQVTLDSGAVIGELTPGINAEMRSIASRRR